ncbi:MAG: hypothetical protein WBZ36_11170 [Candidatus Nitrosopolaris sp.]
MIQNHTSFIVTGAILVAAVATMTLYNVNVANAQLPHVPNMTKTMNMTAGGGNMSKTMNMTGSKMSKTMNMTAGEGNMSKK